MYPSGSPVTHPRSITSTTKNQAITGTSATNTSTQKTQTKTVMKTYLPYSFILAAAASGMAFGAETAYTTPVGYVSLGDTTVGQPAVKAKTDAFVTMPLYRAAEYSGLVSAVAGNVITFGGTPGFTANQWVSATTPYEVHVEDGSVAGFTAAISPTSDATSVTIIMPPGESLAGLIAGNRVTIRKAWTLSTAFPSLPSGSQVIVFGSKVGINVLSDAIYETDGATWFDTDTFDSADAVILYPNEGFKLRSPSATPITSVVISGEVPVSKSRTVLQKYNATKGQDNLIGYMSPVDEIIGVSGLGTTSGDQLIAWNASTAGYNKLSSTILEFDGVDWFDTDTFDTVTTTYLIKAGAAYRYRRALPAPVGPVIVSDKPTYQP